MKLLIDADYIVYKACAAAEDEIDWGGDVITVTSRFSEAYKNVCKDITRIQAQFMWDTPEVVLFFSDSENFRKKIYPDYKGHRNRKKPCGYKRVIRELDKHYMVELIEELEADDAMGIYATANPGHIICSPDKDMKQIPGRLYDMKETVMIDPVEGARWHLIQTIAGDQTDGYSGVPGYGVKRAVNLFEENGYSWETVVDAFAEKDLDEDVALMNARLARILTYKDYDPINRRVIPWTPAPGYRVDYGTEVQDEKAG